MRFLIIITALICISSSPAYSNSGADFDTFIKSREVITTLYFQSNDEDLSDSERQRLFAAISRLRELQENGRLIRVEGFSSPEGDQEKNFLLSFFRARSVVDLIESRGFSAEVTLTGYGDLRAGNDDPNKERRVEITSYLKPVGMKRVNLASMKKKVWQKPALVAKKLIPEDQGIDSYKIDQAIRMKINDKNKSLAGKNETIDHESPSGLSQANKAENNRIENSRIENSRVEKNRVEAAVDLDRRYSLWRKSITPGTSPKLSQSKAAADSKLKRSYSKVQKSVDSENSLGVTQILPVAVPVIDALMIEQAIMEKIGAELLAPSGTVTQVSLVPRQR